jgi:hypothetical protein
MRVEIHNFCGIFYQLYSQRMRVSSFNGTLTTQKALSRSSSGIDHPKIINGLQDMGGYEKRALADMWQDIQGANSWNGLLDPMNQVLKAEILRNGHFAQLCYDAFDGEHSSNDNGGCKYSFDKLFDNCEMAADSPVFCKGYEVTKYLYAETDIVFGTHIKQSSWIGFIAVCTDPKEILRLGRRDIVVAWRGTQTAHEWIQDITDILVSARLSRNARLKHKGVRVEKGFLNCYISVGEDSRCARETVRSEIIRLVDEYKDESVSITLTGHSLGAALATLSSYDVKQMLNAHSPARHIPVTVFAFASPRVGNRAFALRMEEIGVKVLRLVNKNDVVPKVPGIVLNENSYGWLIKVLDCLPWTYFHVGVQILLDNDDSSIFKHIHPAYAHSLKVYLHLIESYVGEGKPFISSTWTHPTLPNKQKLPQLIDLRLSHSRYWWP